MNNFFYQLKIAIRNLRRGGMYSAINIGGLAVGLAACILMMLWVQDELSFDKFHTRSGDIFQTNVCFKKTGNDTYWSIASAPLAFVGKDEIPEIENACRYYSHWGVEMLQYAGDSQERTVNGFTYGMVDSTFFSIFDFPVVEGDAQRMLADPQSVVLSVSIARELFGDESPVGKTLHDNNRNEYHVTGVMADMPQNSSIRFDILLPFSLYEHSQPDELKAWSRFDFKTWFLLRPHTDVGAIEKKLTEIQYRHAQDAEVRYELQSIESVNFHNADGSVNSKVQACRLFIIIAFVVILVACVNYINISTARASRRNKEVFVKNILGARKGNLFFQYLNESVLLFLLSLVVATVLLYMIFPSFNHIAGKQLEFRLFSTQTAIVYGLAFCIIVLCAGIYPAINLATRKPLKGATQKAGSSVLRRMLVVGQFIVAIVLVSVTITTNMQLEYVKKMDLGYDKENVVYVQMPDKMRNHYDAVKSELLQNPSITGVTATSMPLKNVTSTYVISDLADSDEKNQKTILLRTDEDFMATMGVKLIAGRNFSGTPADATSMILNETAVEKLAMAELVGKQCTVAGVKGTIIGVVRDFHFKDLHTPIEPLTIVAKDRRNSLYVKISANGASRAIAAIEKAWKQYESDLPFSYHFVDDDFDAVYKTDLRTSILFQYFAIIAIFISCLGLFGLVTYTAETKTKEIGIRKVLGASVAGIVELLSKEFIILVGVAMLIAFPLAYYWLNKMLQDYAYRIDISWWMFAAAGMVTIMLTLLTVGWQAVKAATANPVKSLKTE